MTSTKRFKTSCLLIATTLVPTSTTFAQAVVAPELPPSITAPAHARVLGLESLKKALSTDGGVPLPPNLDELVRNRQAAIKLGKALFWEMKMGSDGVQACASCHFNAGTDNRSRNQRNPGLLRVKNAPDGNINGLFAAPAIADNAFTGVGPDSVLSRTDYPFVKYIERVVQNADGTTGPGEGNTNDITSSMGMFATLFQGTLKAEIVDRGTRLADPVFNVKGINTHRVAPRNTPTMINAALNYTNFWDGRANNTFNGVNPFGPQDPNASVFVLQTNGGLSSEKIALVNASLASQAVGPPMSPFEMSFGNPAVSNGRTFAELGKKLLRGDAAPLEQQLVDPKDSVLGGSSNYPSRGLSTTYRALIKSAFAPKYWDFKGQLKLIQTTMAKKVTATQPTMSCSYTVEPATSTSTADAAPTKEGNFTQMEANFALFVGLSIMMYESTLISDQTPFDKWMETGTFNDRFDANALAGLNLFVGKGHCSACHVGPEFTSASVRYAQKGKNVIEPMLLTAGPALYDSGFYNIGAVPTSDDVGRGGQDLNGRPLAFSRQSLFRRVLGIEMPFPITGDSTIVALSEEGDVVCADTNNNGFCDPTEPLSEAMKRVAVDGAFKAPGLRNQELMAPYMHNGGFATLRQVVELYNRGGNFCRTNQANLHPDIEPRGMTSDELDKLVSFLLSLTDQRVRLEQEPFDHPELFIPLTGFATPASSKTEVRRVPQIGRTGVDVKNKQPVFLDLDPNDSIFTPADVCSP